MKHKVIFHLYYSTVHFQKLSDLLTLKASINEDDNIKVRNKVQSSPTHIAANHISKNCIKHKNNTKEKIQRTGKIRRNVIFY